jgi:hypothetical protein
MTTLELLEYIAAERAALANCYPLPSPLDCVRYALTELGEYEDAMLRAERTGDKRNNQRPSDARRELGQVGEMLGAAWVQRDDWRDTDEAELDQHSQSFRTGDTGDITRQQCVGVLSIALGWELRDSPGYHGTLSAFVAWLKLVTWHGWDAHALLVERYAQVREKHCQEMQP